jgi:hypothetical protein
MGTMLTISVLMISRMPLAFCNPVAWASILKIVKLRIVKNKRMEMELELNILFLFLI